MQKKYRADLRAAEKKLLLILVTFTIFGMYGLIEKVSVVVEMDSISSAVSNYFACEASGHVPGQCSREKFEKLAIPYLSGISYYFIFIIVPLTILVFVINWKSVLEVMKCKRKVCSTYHRSDEEQF